MTLTAIKDGVVELDGYSVHADAKRRTDVDQDKPRFRYADVDSSADWGNYIVYDTHYEEKLGDDLEIARTWDEPVAAAICAGLNNQKIHFGETYGPDN